jgi:hypothetical protein
MVPWHFRQPVLSGAAETDMVLDGQTKENTIALSRRLLALLKF